MSAGKPTSAEAVAKALASSGELTVAEIAKATRLGRSTVGKALVALERDGTGRRHRGGRDGRRRLPDRWSIGHTAEHDDPAGAATQRLRPGQLDGLVLDYIDSQGTDAVGATRSQGSAAPPAPWAPDDVRIRDRAGRTSLRLPPPCTLRKQLGWRWQRFRRR